MDDTPPPARTRVLLAAILLGAALGGAAGGGVAALLLRAPDDRPVADAVAALAAEGGQADRVAAVAAAVVPSVVRVDVRGLGSNGSEGGAGGSGNASGVLIDDDGHVVTNHHVIAGASSITVTFVDRSSVVATLVGSDPANDLAVLQVEAPDLPPIAIADSAEVQVGQMAVAVGSPFGLNGSVTAGIISAIDRPVDLRVPDGAVVRLPGVIQTDAGISPGNSGGPLVDSAGRMVGVNSAVLSQDFGAGVGFAVPSSIVTDVVADLIADGEVATPWLGLSGTTLDPAAARELEVEAGAVIDAVQDGGPAATAGLRTGDVVTGVEGTALRSMDDLVAVVRDAGVGATIVLDIVRDGTARQVTATIADAADADSGNATDPLTDDAS